MFIAEFSDILTRLDFQVSEEKKKFSFKKNYQVKVEVMVNILKKDLKEKLNFKNFINFKGTLLKPFFLKHVITS